MSILESVALTNFRGFTEHSAELRPVTVAVGRNNAGKSTLVEGLRLLSIVVNRLPYLQLKPVPAWLDLPKSHIGVSPSLERMGLHFESMFNRYSDPPAKITGTFSSGASIDVYVGGDKKVFAVPKSKKGAPVQSRRECGALAINQVHILPQIGPLASDEKILDPDYVQAHLSSTLASLHFRNQLNLLRSEFPAFKRLAQDSWPGLAIVGLEGRGKSAGTPLALLVKDSDFVAEIAWMGHGLQMWLQTMWFLSRVPTSATVILDEPDVYMHPDLQRRLFRLVRSRFRQSIIATHSVEIMQESDPRHILIIDRRRPKSRFADSHPAVQALVENIGSISHLQLARLWHAKKCLLVEGDDVEFLAQVHEVLFPDTVLPLEQVPHVPLGGWGGWAYAVGSTILLQNSVGEDVKTYCVMDSDYHTPEAIAERKADASARGIRLHVWRRKEIENYLLVPEAIARVIASAMAASNRLGDPPTPEVIREKIDEIALSFTDDVFDAFAHEYLIRDKGAGLATANERARTLMKSVWSTPEGRLERSPGKDVVSKLSGWAKSQYGVSFGPMTIARELRQTDVATEVRGVLEAIEGGNPLD